MDLFFQCPDKRAGFWSSSWTTDQGLRVHEEQDGSRRLRGAVRVHCPLCQAEHAFSPDELACPLTVAGHERTRSPNTKGGT